MPDLPVSQTGALQVARGFWRGWRLAFLGVVAVLLAYAGVSWRLGWFPFANNEASMLDAVTAPGPSTLSQAELEALLKQTSAPGTSKLTKEQQAALVSATSVE